MTWLWITLGIIAVIATILLSVMLYCFFKTFYSPKRHQLEPDKYEIPPGEEYEEFLEVMVEWVKEVRRLKGKEFTIKSKDGLTLKAKYYECKEGAPIELMFHGYRGYAERDMSGGVERAFDVGHNALLIDHRASGLSDGHVITFGIKERDDCLRWIDFAIKQFGNDVQIILTGISMGAATVLMVSNENLPNNVKYILADCGYTSPKEIIYKVILDMKLPPKLVFPIIKLSARIFGGFNIDKYSAIESVKSTKLPIIFYHGTNDNFVPYDMSKTLYDACISHKKLVLVDNAGHGLSYPVEKEKYISALVEFENEIKQKKSDN